MTVARDLRAELQAISDSAGFNSWAGFEVVAAEPGEVALRLGWRAEFGQYAGHLHAGMMSALIDTACGFAAYTTAGPVVASHCAVSYLAPGRGSAFVATARTIKAGRRQVFVSAELTAESENGDEGPRVVATGQTILIPTG